MATEDLPPAKQHTDALLARASSRLVDGQPIQWTDLAGLAPVAAGDVGTPNHKWEAAATFYAAGVAQPSLKGKDFNHAWYRQRLLMLTDHQLTVGAWSVPGGPKNSFRPVSEFASVSHGKHWLRGLMVATWAARKAGDEELLGKLLLLLGQILVFLRLCAGVDRHVYVAGPRAFKPGDPTPKNPTGHIGTDAVLDEFYRRAFDLTAAPRREKWSGDDMLAVRLLDSLLPALADRLGAALEARPDVSDADLPVSLDPITICWAGNDDRRDTACWGPWGFEDTTDPGPQYAAGVVNGQPFFYVPYAVQAPSFGFLGHQPDGYVPVDFPWSGQRWHTRPSPAALPHAGAPQTPAGPAPAPTTPAPAPSGPGLAGALGGIVSRTRALAEARPAAKTLATGIANDLEPLVAKVAELERSRG